MTLARRLPFFYGWIVVAVAFVTMAISTNARTGFSLLFPPLLDEFGWERGLTAAAWSVGLASAMLYAPLIGAAMDRLGPRLLMPLGALIMAAGFVLATEVETHWQLYLTLGLLVVGPSTLLSYTGHFVFLPNWFARKRGLALGIVFAGVGVGAIVIFPWVQATIDAEGWRRACWALAVLLVVVIVPLNFFFQRAQPSDVGLEPDGDGRGSAAPKPSLRVVDPDWAAVDWTLGKALRTARFWLFGFGAFSALFAWYAVLVHQSRYLIDLGFDAKTAAYALGLVNLLAVAGQPLFGHLSDRIGREWVWTISCLGFAATYALLLLLAWQPSAFLLYAMVAAQGLIGYALVSVFGAIPAEIFQGRHYGAIFGTASIVGNSGAAAGPWVTGLLFDATGSYALPFAMAIGFSLLSIALIWLAAPRKVRAVAG
ncbi:MAG: MFS transporter [Pseudomonadota bacterium]